jgi:hypothetical protein
VYQITCSPINNTIPLPMRIVFHIGWSNTVERIVRFIDRWTRVPPVPIHWHHPSGPHFGNMLALLTLDERSPRIRLERSVKTEATDEREAGAGLELIEDLHMTEAPRIAQLADAHRSS